MKKDETEASGLKVGENFIRDDGNGVEIALIEDILIRKVAVPNTRR